MAFFFFKIHRVSSELNILARIREQELFIKVNLDSP